MIAQACWIMHLILFPHDTSCDVLHMYLGNARWPAFNVLIRPPMAMIDGIDAVNRPNIASVSSNRCIWSMLGVCSLRNGVQIRHWSPSTVPAAHYKPSSMSIIEVLLDIAADCRPSLWLWCGVFACHLWYRLSLFPAALWTALEFLTARSSLMIRMCNFVMAMRQCIIISFEFHYHVCGWFGLIRRMHISLMIIYLNNFIFNNHKNSKLLISKAGL